MPQTLPPSDRLAVTHIRWARTLLSLIIVWFSGCQSVFLSGRQQFDIIPEKQEIALGAKAYQEVLDTEPKSQNAHLGQMLERVGQRLAAVSERPDFQWEFTLLSGPSQNAFCLPGGKVAVYEGILPVCATEAGLAVVMSHEIAHALARHGGERMTQQLASESGEWALGRILGSGDSKKIALMKNVYGLGAQYGVLLPFSRTQESEADSIGLLLMARAGYDPQEAPRFWERFGQVSGPSVPELLSTHPSDETRAAKLQEIVPRALSVYQSAPQRHGLGEHIPMQALAELMSKPASTPTTTSPAAAALAVVTPAAPVVAAVPAPAAPPISTAGVTIAPVPVVQAVPVTTPPTATTTATPDSTDVAVTLPDLGAPTNEGAPATPAVTPAVVVATDASANPVVPAVHAVTTPATETISTGEKQSATETTVAEKPAAPASAAPVEENQPPVLDETNGWKPHDAE